MFTLQHLKRAWPSKWDQSRYKLQHNQLQKWAWPAYLYYLYAWNQALVSSMLNSYRAKFASVNGAIVSKLKGCTHFRVYPSRVYYLVYMIVCTCVYLVLHNFSIGLDEWLGIEGSFPKQHLIDANAQRPPVTLSTIHTLTILHGLCVCVCVCVPFSLDQGVWGQDYQPYQFLDICTQRTYMNMCCLSTPTLLV